MLDREPTQMLLTSTIQLVLHRKLPQAWLLSFDFLKI